MTVKSKKPLTPRQKKVLDFIRKFAEENGYSPSLGEIAKFLKKSISTAQHYVEELKNRGYLRKEENIARGISPVPEASDRIFLLGYIAAGEPIEPLENPEPVEVPLSMMRSPWDYYALKVKGNSMVDDGIFDGDIVIIRHQRTADNGETVVAITEDGATLKKLYRDGDKIRLQPANQALLPIFPKEIEIRGKVMGIIRNVKQETSKTLTRKIVKGEKFQRRTDFSWDYRGVNTKPYTHVFHQYPAMFIPQVVKRLIQSYSQAGDTVCDIFCGSGTALVESKLLGRNSWGIDLNPHAIFLARAKTTPLDPLKLQRVYFQLIDRYFSIPSNEVKIPNFFNIEFWFKPRVISDLAKLKQAILEIKEDPMRRFFLVSFSHAARAASNTRGGEFKLFRIPEDKLRDYNPDMLKIFQEKTEENIKGMADFCRDADKTKWVKLIEGDSTKDNGIPAESMDLIITSPPYGDSRTTVAYGQFSRLSMQWLDLVQDDHLQIDNEMLGGRPTLDLANNLPSSYLKPVVDKIANLDERRAKDVLSFFLDLEKAIKQAYKILKPQKYFCLVIGNRTVKGIRIPTDFIIAELGENIGFKLMDIFVRNIPNKRMPLKNSPTNVVGQLEETMSKESIIILKKT